MEYLPLALPDPPVQLQIKTSSSHSPLKVLLNTLKDIFPFVTSTFVHKLTQQEAPERRETGNRKNIQKQSATIRHRRKLRFHDKWNLYHDCGQLDSECWTP